MFLVRSILPRKVLSTTLDTLLIRSISNLKTFPSIISPDKSAAMAEREKVPMLHEDVQDVQTLIRNLGDHQKSNKGKKGFSCKKATFDVDASTANLTVDSWRFQDWDYKRDDLPTYARGLFITKNEKGQPEIAIRGYDKFFNVEEVNATKWRNIENDTKGPYELSLKENGCIIFISGLYDGSLLVCSKHSTGDRGDANLSHAKAGEKWLDRQLKALGRSREDLARELRNRNATAVAELCDDEFEEHILPYVKDNAGLYLHGINLNLPEFVTYSGAQVQAFATEWGFRKTDYLMLDDIQTTKSFLEQVGETGSYNGRDLEGFVIRCKSNTYSSGPNADWFFKYKFEEPYLMYRQWRECTKAVISGKPPRFKKHVKITEEYLLFARKRLVENKGLGKQYQQNHGIIKLRNDFLKEKNLKGSDIIREEYAATGGAPEDISKDVVLLPIATIGCGKTTIAVALQHLFDWGHVQNDNITGKGRPPRFTKEVLTQLEDKPVVIADRNNAQKHERKQILDDIQKTHPNVRLVALNFAHSPQTLDKIRQITQDRVFSRGDNHQTIQAATDQNKVRGIMEGFIQRFEALNPLGAPDDGFDTVIELDPTAESRQNLETVIGQLHNHYPKLFSDMPTSEELDEAITFALSEYKPDLRHEIGDRGPKGKNSRNNRDQQHQQKEPAQIFKKKRPLEYISVTLPRSIILEALDTAFASVSSRKGQFYKSLQENHHIQDAFHVTLMHRASAKQHPEIWERYSQIHAEAGSAENKLGSCNILLERIVFDNRILAIVVRIVDEEEGGWESVNQVAHITVGTRSNDVKPKESNDLLKRWLEGGSGDSSGIGDVPIEGRQIVAGTVKRVLSRPVH